MAYVRQMLPTRPGPGDPGVLWVYLQNSAAETNCTVKVPWDNVELVYGYTYVATAIDATANCEIDLELNAAGGTELGTATIAKSAAVGTVGDITIDTSNKTPLGNGNAINVEVDGSASAAGAVMVYLYFEPANA